MIKFYCDRCGKEVQRMELSEIDFSNFYVKPQRIDNSEYTYRLCGQCQIDIVKKLNNG